MEPVIAFLYTMLLMSHIFTFLNVHCCNLPFLQRQREKERAHLLVFASTVLPGTSHSAYGLLVSGPGLPSPPRDAAAFPSIYQLQGHLVTLTGRCFLSSLTSRNGPLDRANATPFTLRGHRCIINFSGQLIRFLGIYLPAFPASSGPLFPVP